MKLLSKIVNFDDLFHHEIYPSFISKLKSYNVNECDINYKEDYVKKLLIHEIINKTLFTIKNNFIIIVDNDSTINEVPTFLIKTVKDNLPELSNKIKKKNNDFNVLLYSMGLPITVKKSFISKMKKEFLKKDVISLYKHL